MKGKCIVGPKIPDHHHPCCDELREVKIDSVAFVEQIDDGVVEGQPDQGSEQKLREFARYGGIVAVKSPNTVEDVVAHDCASEPDAVSKVLVESQFFFAQPGEAEVNCRAGDADNAEFEEFQQNLLHEGRSQFWTLDF